MLFDNKRRHSVSLPAADSSGKPANIAFLIDYLCRNLMKDPRADLFVLDNHMYVLPCAPCSISVLSLTRQTPRHPGPHQRRRLGARRGRGL
jgi:hypothetical protein